ncbi:PCYCGC domain-containing protein [Paenibacillus hamazuiensis]|uniref:PCYCGC domain-containing protein n=1 Tax=Paenibacillus hamazuiensis TaxID=2936508 RepID=UPI00200DB2E2|nr:PCYCGC domain-containing protein [Paenibacillus hamazuiensis]
MTFSYKGAIVALSIAFVLSACGSNKDQGHQSHAVSGDIQEKTASADVAPSFLKGQPEQIRLVYEAAGKASDILKWIPCYCGCGESAGHTSNLNCFVKEVNSDGSIVWDDHGTRCGVCLQIAVQSIKMKQDGKSLKEIRTFIDKTYEKGYAKPTKTPLPA